MRFGSGFARHPSGLLLGDGDSIMAEDVSLLPYIETELIQRGCRIASSYNSGVDGQRLAQMISNASTEIDARLLSGNQRILGSSKKQSLVYLEGGTNDILADHATGEAVAADVAEYMADRRAALTGSIRAALVYIPPLFIGGGGADEESWTDLWDLLDAAVWPGIYGDAYPAGLRALRPSDVERPDGIHPTEEYSEYLAINFLAQAGINALNT